jgi:hypothetical protein
MIPFGWHYWRGASKNNYRFKITLTRAGLPSEGGGIYVFVRRWFFFFLQPLYVGQAKNFRERLFGHEKWPRAIYKFGATERHVLRVVTDADRDSIEEDLIRGLNPPMNTVLVVHAGKDRPVHQALDRWWWVRNRLRLFSRRAHDRNHPQHHAR